VDGESGGEKAMEKRAIFMGNLSWGAFCAGFLITTNIASMHQNALDILQRGTRRISISVIAVLVHKLCKKRLRGALTQKPI